MTCEDGISVTHTLDGLFEVANNAEKALSNLKDGVAKLGQTIYYARNIEVNLPDALFVPNSLLNQFRRETAEMLDEARLANYPRGSRKGRNGACAGLPGHASLVPRERLQPQSACVLPSSRRAAD